MLVTILKRYVWVINLILLAALAYLLALSVNAKIQGEVTSHNAEASQNFFPDERKSRQKTNKNVPLSSYSIIATRNIFGVSDQNHLMLCQLTQTHYLNRILILFFSAQ